MITIGIIDDYSLSRLNIDTNCLVGVSMGDPAGIGPEIILDSIAQLPAPDMIPVVFGSFSAFRQVLSMGVTGQKNRFKGVKLNPREPVRSVERKKGQVVPRSVPDAFFVDIDPLMPDYEQSILIEGGITPGESNRLCGRIAFESFKSAVAAADKRITGSLVTAPVSKSRVSEGIGSSFLGHTGWLGDYFNKGENETGMLFYTGDTAVSLVTVHEPMGRLQELLTIERIRDTILLTWKTMKELFGRKQPRLGVLGFNPHAGESGFLGDEEEKSILPAIKAAMARGVEIAGPLPADTAFSENVLSAFDAVVAMYHDQALGPLKALYPFGSVNITMGLPIIRTSPDHGTAFDIAGKGLADPSGFIAALDLAATLAAGKVPRSPKERAIGTG